jgi:hypothetical protein
LRILIEFDDQFLSKLNSLFVIAFVKMSEIDQIIVCVIGGGALPTKPRKKNAPNFGVKFDTYECKGFEMLHPEVEMGVGQIFRAKGNIKKGQTVYMAQPFFTYIDGTTNNYEAMLRHMQAIIFHELYPNLSEYFKDLKIQHRGNSRVFYHEFMDDVTKSFPERSLQDNELYCEIWSKIGYNFFAPLNGNQICLYRKAGYFNRIETSEFNCDWGYSYHKLEPILNVKTIRDIEIGEELSFNLMKPPVFFEKSKK